jgi:prevent-host-death family protein
MSTIISQRELRNDSGRVMDRVEHGERFTITRHGVPVAELVPAVRRRTFVPLREVAGVFRGLDRIDYAAMRAEADEFFGDGGDRI